MKKLIILIISCVCLSACTLSETTDLERINRPEIELPIEVPDWDENETQE